MRIKNLEQISDQYDRVSAYLTSQHRYKSACKVDKIFEAILACILNITGSEVTDDESIETAYNEPVLVSEYQRLP